MGFSEGLETLCKTPAQYWGKEHRGKDFGRCCPEHVWHGYSSFAAKVSSVVKYGHQNHADDRDL